MDKSTYVQIAAGQLQQVDRENNNARVQAEAWRKNQEGNSVEPQLEALESSQNKQTDQLSQRAMIKGTEAAALRLKIHSFPTRDLALDSCRDSDSRSILSRGKNNHSI